MPRSIKTEQIPNNIKKIREELGLTQEQLGKILGVSGRTIRSYESKCDNGIIVDFPIDKAMALSNETLI